MTPRKSKKERLAIAKGERERGRYLPTNVGYVLTLCLFSAATIWIRTGFPPYAVGAAVLDDALFVRLAKSLTVGAWLGDYNEATLAKGMFYPLFICLSHLIHVPLKVAEQIAYLVACGLTAELVRRRSKNPYFGGILFALLAFNPVVWTTSLSRVIREGIYLSLSLLVVIVFLQVIFAKASESRSQIWLRFFSAFALGLFGAAFWLTREEGIWLAPTLMLLILLAGWKIFRASADQAERIARIKATAVPLALTLVVFLACDFLVAGLNYHYYGIFETNEFRSKGFLRAYGALTRIHQDHWQRYVVFPKDARERAYSVSAAAREMKPLFEGPVAAGWRHNSCVTIQMDPCSEVLVGWFSWQLRQNVAMLGHAETAREAMRFYDQLADQIDAGCAVRKIDCLPGRNSLLPEFRREYLRPMIQSTETLLKTMFTLNGGGLGTSLSSGSAEQLALFTEMVGNLGPPGPPVIQGWAAATTGKPNVQISSEDPRYRYSSVYAPADDISARYPDLKAIRFQLTTNCKLDACDLVIDATELPRADFPLSQLSTGQIYKSEAMALRVEHIGFLEQKVGEDDPQPVEVEVASMIAKAYRIGLPILTVLGVIGVALAIARGGLRTVPIELWALCAASLAAIGTRIAILVYIDVTSAPATGILYCSPASPFVIIFAALGTYFGYIAIGGYSTRPTSANGEET